jgi:hypothetical protein
MLQLKATLRVFALANYMNEPCNAFLMKKEHSLVAIAL